MTPTVKIVAGIASIGVVGSGIGYAISEQFTTENISKKLIDEGYQILDETENNEWTSILDSYLKSSKFKFRDFDIKEKEVEKLKQACKKALNNPSTDKDIYDKAEYWCTVPRTVADLLNKDRYRALSTKTDDESDNNIDREEWNKKLDEHAKAAGDEKTKQFTGDNKIAIEGKKLAQKKENRDAIKKQCDSLNKKKHYEADFETNLAKSKLWCAIHKTADS